MAASAQVAPPLDLSALAAGALRATSIELPEKATSLTEAAASLQVTSKPKADRASELLAAIADLRREVRETFDPITKQAYDLHKAVVARRNEKLQPLDAAEAALKGKLNQWITAEQERAQREQERETERLRLAEEKRQAQLAEQLERDGMAPEQAAEAAEQTVESTPLPPPMAQPRTVAGISTRKKYVARVTSMRALCKAIAEGKAPTNLVKANESGLRDYVKAFGAEAELPGVEFEEQRTVTRR